MEFASPAAALTVDRATGGKWQTVTARSNTRYATKEHSQTLDVEKTHTRRQHC